MALTITKPPPCLREQSLKPKIEERHPHRQVTGGPWGGESPPQASIVTKAACWETRVKSLILVRKS